MFASQLSMNLHVLHNVFFSIGFHTLVSHGERHCSLCWSHLEKLQMLIGALVLSWILSWFAATNFTSFEFAISRDGDIVKKP